jgi:hypothetical protein
VVRFKPTNQIVDLTRMGQFTVSKLTIEIHPDLILRTRARMLLLTSDRSPTHLRGTRRWL